MTFKRLRKVVHVITGLQDGGAEAVLSRLVLNSPQFEHLVISLSRSGKYSHFLKSKNVNVIHLNLSRNRTNLYKFFRLIFLLKKEKPDVVQTWMYHADLFGGLAARLAGVKNVIWGLHNTTLHRNYSSKLTQIICYINGKLSWIVPRKIISCSHTGKFLHKKIGYQFEKIICVPNGYDFSSFRPEKNSGEYFRAKFNIDKNTTLIGCIARYSPQKDHNNLLKAFKKILNKNKNSILIFIGSGMNNQNAGLCKLVSNLGLTDSVILAGQFDNIVPVMNALDVHVLPSAFGEAFPNVLCEAIACGTICATTNVGDSRFIVNDERLICEPSDPNALFETIQNAFKMDTAVFKAAARARIMRKYSIKKMIKGYSDVWFDNSKPKCLERGALIKRK